MFKKKKKKKKLTLHMLNKNRELLMETTVQDIVLKEEYIIATSTEKYGTDEPCIIYRTCIADDIHLQINQILQKVLEQGKDEINYSELPTDIVDSINLDIPVEWIRLVVEEV